MVKNASPILAALRNATVNEAAAVEFLEAQRWGGTPACPRCGSVSVYQMKAATGERNKDYRWRCRDCVKSQMFTVRTGTTFEESRLPLRVWVFAFWKACASKKGVSALQLAREMEITHKSALFVLRRIRHGMTDHSQEKFVGGTVEVDETYVGGKLRARQGRGHGRRGNPGTDTNKTAVVAMVQRDGNVRYRMMQRVTAKTLANVIAENADLSCRIITDESPAYTKLGRKFHKHETVKHGAREYVRGDVHSNTVEGVFSLLKRGVMGTFHSVTRKHLPNYLGEFEFRWNTRKNDDGERVRKAVRAMEGKRIEYRESVDNPPYLVG